MPADRPHFLLFAEATNSSAGAGQWRFALQPIGGGETITAEDVETGISSDRLELLVAVRGLEALAGPSRVTLLTRSRYVRRGLGHDLAQWRAMGWRWERFGRLTPIRDQDLWQRLDRTLTIHEVAYWPWPQDGQTPAAADLDDAAVTTYGIACAGAIEPSFEPTLVIVQQNRTDTKFSLRRPRKLTRQSIAGRNRDGQRWNESSRPELSRTA